MLIVGKDILEKFWQKYPDAKNALTLWIQTVEAANWQNPAEMKRAYPSADLVGDCTVFNIRGNNYRLIAIISYIAQTVFVLYVLTHKEYDKDKWKKDCNC